MPSQRLDSGDFSAKNCKKFRPGSAWHCQSAGWLQITTTTGNKEPPASAISQLNGKRQTMMSSAKWPNWLEDVNRRRLNDVSNQAPRLEQQTLFAFQRAQQVNVTWKRLALMRQLTKGTRTISRRQHCSITCSLWLLCSFAICARRRRSDQLDAIAGSSARLS